MNSHLRQLDHHEGRWNVEEALQKGQAGEWAPANYNAQQTQQTSTSNKQQ